MGQDVTPPLMNESAICCIHSGKIYFDMKYQRKINILKMWSIKSQCMGNIKIKNNPKQSI
jgi:hypothetical protein